MLTNEYFDRYSDGHRDGMKDAARDILRLIEQEIEETRRLSFEISGNRIVALDLLRQKVREYGSQ